MENDYEIDMSELIEIEKEESPYDEFYSECVDVIKIFFIYVDRDNKIKFIKNDKILIENSKLNKVDLSVLIKKNRKHNAIYYQPLSILKYNIDLNSKEITSYLNFPDDYNFLVNEKYITDIVWNNSISLFKDLNSLHIIYYETKKKPNKDQTKRIKLINKLNARNTRKKNNLKHTR